MERRGVEGERERERRTMDKSEKTISVITSLFPLDGFCEANRNKARKNKTRYRQPSFFHIIPSAGAISGKRAPNQPRIRGC